MKENFNLSDELMTIFLRSAEFVKETGYKEISTEILFYYFLTKYLKDGAGEDKILNEFFSSLSKEDSEDILNKVKKIVTEEVSEFNNPLPDSYIHNDFPVANSSAVCDILNRARMEQFLFYRPTTEDNEKITISSHILFLSMLFENDCEVVNILYSYQINKEELTKEIMNNSANLDIVDNEKDIIEKRLEGSIEEDKNSDSESDMLSDDDKEFELAGKSDSVEDPIITNSNSKTPYLDKYGVDMIMSVKNGKYDKVVGREKELKQLIEILCCRKKNNALIMSQKPGSGKSSLVELLAQKIYNGDVPDELKGKRIFSLNLNSIVSGKIYRGQAEQVYEEIIKEVINSNHSIIVFIDEFQCLINNGASSGSGSGADILKPYLARGEFQTIGALLVEDYRKYIEPEQALKRRFQNVVIDEPEFDEIINILKGIQNKYSEYHRVKYSNEVLKACVDLSTRYINDRFQPDSSIDVLDLSGSLTKLRKLHISPKSYEDLLTKLSIAKKNKNSAVVDKQDFELAEKYREEEKAISSEIDKIKKEIDKEENNPKNWPEVTIDDVLNVVSKISSIPVDRINKSDSERIRYMKDQMERSVIGQQEAINSITLALQRNILGLRDENKPIASLYFAGLSSVGKTLCCKELAKHFFGSEKNLIRFDMGEFSHDSDISKLIATTSGYVGYNDPPLLDQVKRRPYSVVLFDEIEKMAPGINNIFLNILSEGYVTLGNGTRVDFKNTIIVFTSNIGSKELSYRGDGLGFSTFSYSDKKEKDQEIVMKAMRKHFKPEFINRLTEVVVFNELTKEDYEKIFDLEIKKVADRLSKKKIKLSVTKNIKNKIVSESTNAREIEKEIIKYVENEICNSIIEKSIDLAEISGISVDYKEEKSIVSFTEKKKKKSSSIADETKSSENSEMEKDLSLEESR